MNVQPECVSCLMNRVLFQARLLDSGCEFAAVQAALRTYGKEFSPGRNSAEVATEVHRSAYEVMKADPYCQMKLDADRIAGEFLDEVTAYVDSSDDRFAAAVRVAVIGNIMDFGLGLAIKTPEEFRGRFHSLLDQGIGADDTEAFRASVEHAGTVLYFFDNCGESQFDKLLIREMQRMGCRVVGVVRGERILNDVTTEDAKRIGLDKILDGIVSTGLFAIGVRFDKAGKDLKDELSKADLIVAKGMANYESMSDQPTSIPKVYIMRTKCTVVANSLGVPPDINVVRFSQPEK
jgi:uncharacterized protein with ATP-grasp and redox domains